MRLPFCLKVRDMLHKISYHDEEDKNTYYLVYQHISDHPLKPHSRHFIRYHCLPKISQCIMLLVLKYKTMKPHSRHFIRYHCLPKISQCIMLLVLKYKTMKPHSRHFIRYHCLPKISQCIMLLVLKYKTMLTSAVACSDTHLPKYFQPLL